MIPTSKFINDLKRAGGMTKVKLRRLKGLKWKYPLSLERQYEAAINRFMSKRWKEYAKIAVPMMVPRVDALQDLEPVPGTNGPALGAIVSVSKSLSEFNRRELNAFKKIAIGEVFAEDEPWLKNVLDEWSREQVTLITKATQDMLDTVARRIRDGVKVGKSAKEVTALINADLPGISYRRARIIARDQTAKLNSSLTQGRMTDAGLETYVWDTAQDERVRGDPSGLYPKALPSHFVMQGKICRWDDPTVWLENGEWVKRAGDAPYFHPGMAIMCRCVAVPNWNELEGVEGSDLPAVPEEVEPPKVDVPEDQGLFQNEKTFVDTLSSRFNVDGIEPEQLDSAFAMIKNMPKDAQKAYEIVLTRFIADISNGGKAEFNTETKKILLFAKAKGNDLVHEAGHAIDSMIGTKYGRDFASAVKRGKFGNRNLGEIIKDELVSPILESAKAYRLDALRDAAKKIPPEVFEIIKKNSAEQYIQANKILFAISDMDIDRDVKVFILSLFNSDAGDDVIKSLAAGNTKRSIEHLAVALNNPDYEGVFKMVDSMTKPMRELKELARGAGSINALSDMFEAATGIPGIFDDFGHGFGYWAFSPDRKSGEAFAEILEMIGSDEKGTRKILEKYLPTSRDFVLDLIKEAR